MTTPKRAIKDDTNLPNKFGTSMKRKHLKDKAETQSKMILLDQPKVIHNGLLNDSISHDDFDNASSNQQESEEILVKKVNIDPELKEDMEIRNNLLTNIGSSAFTCLQKKYDDYKRIEKEKADYL